MFKKLPVLLIAIIALLTTVNINSTAAQDGFFGDAQTLRSGTASLGIQPVYFTESEEGMLMFRGAYGLSGNMALHGKLGVLEDDTYAGGHLEIGVASEPSSEISLALLGGVHVWNEPGLKISAVFSKRWDQVSIFSGLSYEPIFYDGNTLDPLLIPVGIDVHLPNSSANLILETDIAANDDGEFLQAITGGIYFYL